MILQAIVDGRGGHLLSTSVEPSESPLGQAVIMYSLGVFTANSSKPFSQTNINKYIYLFTYLNALHIIGNTYVYAYTDTLTVTHTHTHRHRQTHTRTHTHTHTRTHTHTHRDTERERDTHTHTYIP